MKETDAIPREISILETNFDPLLTQREYQQQHLQGRTDYGAAASFIGTMRDFNEGDEVAEMELEHYPKMTRRQLNAMVDAAAEQWSIQDVLIIHRVGKILPGETIMMVVVWSAHRAAAFDACRFMMEELKHRAPFWKKEKFAEGGSRWVEKNTDGYN